MCGIAGLVYKNKAADAALLKRMSDTLSHRGPDDDGFFVEENVGLAHRRLSIIDLSGGHQPIYSQDRNLVIVFNGEIYNHEELRADFVRKGHVYATRSDTETILHAYQEYGVDCVKHLRGMFAFCIYDKKEKRLFLARDRVGKKPVYYYHDGSTFLFASEPKAILETGLVKKSVNRKMIDFYLSVGYVPGRESLFQNIVKLEPGHTLVLDRNHKLTIQEYWDVKSIQETPIPYEEARRKLREKLLESVNIRLMSEVPLGVFLSGGLDSSTIVALMSELVSQPIQTFSVGYENEPESSELEYAKIVAKKFKTEHHEFYLSPDDLFDSIETFLEHCEEPLVESAGIALYKLSKLARTRATVILSGEGSDEILAGYPIYAKMKSLERLHFVSKFLPIHKIIAGLNGHSEKMAKYLDWIDAPFKERYRSLSYDLSRSIKAKMYTPQFSQELSGAFDGYYQALLDKTEGKTLLGKMTYVDIKSWLAEDILLKADRMTMAASIELRAPFLDQELIELALSLPNEYKLKDGKGKHILKDIVKDVLPAEIVYRKKRGFPVPLTSWFGGELKQRAQSLLLDKKTIDRGYFNADYLKGLFEKISAGQDLGRRIFSLVVLEMWHRKYID